MKRFVQIFGMSMLMCLTASADPAAQSETTQSLRGMLANTTDMDEASAFVRGVITEARPITLRGQENWPTVVTVYTVQMADGSTVVFGVGGGVIPADFPNPEIVGSMMTVDGIQHPKAGSEIVAVVNAKPSARGTAVELPWGEGDTALVSGWLPIFEASPASDAVTCNLRAWNLRIGADVGAWLASAEGGESLSKTEVLDRISAALLENGIPEYVR